MSILRNFPLVSGVVLPEDPMLQFYLQMVSKLPCVKYLGYVRMQLIF